MQKRMILLSIAFLMISSSLGIFPIGGVTADSFTIYIDGDNAQGPWVGTYEHPFKHIQNGVDAVTEGGTVYVHNGLYYENLLIGKTMTLIGDDKSNTTIDGGGTGDVLNVSANHVNISGFAIKNGTNGVMIRGSSGSTITQNTITETNCGMYIGDLSRGNNIHNNNFLNNTQSAYDLSSNIWNSPSTGNYWDDYTGIDSDGDGIGDTPYNISGGDNQDMYPLMEPITEPPIADFTQLPFNPTTQDVIRFTDTSTDLDGYIISWSWSFGDGATSTEQNATHKYADDGSYIVTLKVIDNYGVSNETSRQIDILNVGPTADFGYLPVSPTDSQSVTFNDTSIDLDGDIVSWLWDFGDGSTSTLQNPSYQYSDNGTYTVTLNVTDDDDATDGTSHQISVSNVGPTADFTYSSANITVIVNDPVQFTDTSKDNDGTIVSWFWNFGDGTTSTGRHPTYSYIKKGTYAVSLTVTDNDGDSDTKTKYITVSVIAPIEPNEVTKGLSSFDVVLVVFLAIIVVMVIILSKKCR